jgi:hypothetical protein
MKLERERKTVEAMIRLFCKDTHYTESLCEPCEALLAYANERLDHCPFGEEKPKCSHCEVHCYTPDMRKRITEVMRYSGPRMLLHHPVMALRHVTQR